MTRSTVSIRARTFLLVPALSLALAMGGSGHALAAAAPPANCVGTFASNSAGSAAYGQFVASNAQAGIIRAIVGPSASSDTCNF